MAFRCLTHKSVENYTTGANIGSTTTATYTLPGAPLMPGTLNVTVLLSLAPNEQTLRDDTTSLSHAAALTVTGRGGTAHVDGATIDHFSGLLTLTFNQAPGEPVNCQTTYTGHVSYSLITDRLFMANCPKSNLQCNSRSSAYVPAITVCNQFIVR